MARGPRSSNDRPLGSEARRARICGDGRACTAGNGLGFSPGHLAQDEVCRLVALGAPAFASLFEGGIPVMVALGQVAMGEEYGHDFKVAVSKGTKESALGSISQSQGIADGQEKGDEAWRVGGISHSGQKQRAGSIPSSQQRVRPRKKKADASNGQIASGGKKKRSVAMAGPAMAVQAVHLRGQADDFINIPAHDGVEKIVGEAVLACLARRLGWKRGAGPAALGGCAHGESFEFSCQKQKEPRSRFFAAGNHRRGEGLRASGEPAGEEISSARATASRWAASARIMSAMACEQE